MLSFREKLIHKIDQLTPDQQKKVLDFTTELAREDDALPAGTPGQVLLKFVGSIAADDLARMEEAIKDCDRVDADGW